VSIGGGKSDHTSLVVLDYYASQGKLFLTHIYDSIKPHEEISSDQYLLEIIKEHRENVKFLAVDAPLALPFCVDCKCKAQNIQDCRQKEVVWMWKVFRKLKRKKPKAKLFTPYTTRACEIFLTAEFDEAEFHPIEALGSNTAPLTARIQFLRKRLKGLKVIEVQPKVTVWRVGRRFKIAQSHLKHYKHSMGGDESRHAILQGLVKHDVTFIYQADFNKLVENINSFDAFMAGLTGFLKFLGQTEKPPKDFPNQTGWIEIPVENPKFD